jgi:hypothetical protein
MTGLTVPDTGALATDLEAYLRAGRDVLSHPLVRVIAPDLLAEAARNQELLQALVEAVRQPRREQAASLLERAIARGELPADTDVDLALDMVAGPLYWRLAVTHAEVSDGYLRRLVSVLVRAFGALWDNADVGQPACRRRDDQIGSVGPLLGGRSAHELPAFSSASGSSLVSPGQLPRWRPARHRTGAVPDSCRSARARRRTLLPQTECVARRPTSLYSLGSWLPRSASAVSHSRCSSVFAGFAACLRGRPATSDTSPLVRRTGGEDDQPNPTVHEATRPCWLHCSHA